MNLKESDKPQNAYPLSAFILMFPMFRFALEASFAVCALIECLVVHGSLLSPQKVNGWLLLTLTHFLHQPLIGMPEMVKQVRSIKI